MSKEELYQLIYVENLSYTEIGRRLGITGAGVRKRALKLGLSLPKRREINAKETFNKNTSKRLKPCEYCGKLTTNAKFCSKECQWKYFHKGWTKDWKSGLKTGIKGEYSISVPLRKYLFDKYQNKCARCGWGEVNPHTGRIPLEVEHIDGDFKNNSEENLILLCPNCHSLTSTYKGANRGRGRKNRRKYN